MQLDSSGSHCPWKGAIMGAKQVYRSWGCLVLIIHTLIYCFTSVSYPRLHKRSNSKASFGIYATVECWAVRMLAGDYGLAAWYRYRTSLFFFPGAAVLQLMTLLLLSKHEKLPLWEIKAIKTSFAVVAFKPKCACVVLYLHITSTTTFNCHFCSCVSVCS